VLDGDVDPEWVENLNSVLDDNKLLTLPSGERLNIPPNVRIMFEVKDLKQATPATVSRCGMVWFSENVITKEMLSSHYIDYISTNALTLDASSKSSWLSLQNTVMDVIRPYFGDGGRGGIVARVLDMVDSQKDHIMFYSHARVLGALFAMIKNIVRLIKGHESTYHSRINVSRLDR